MTLKIGVLILGNQVTRFACESLRSNSLPLKLV